MYQISQTHNHLVSEPFPYTNNSVLRDLAADYPIFFVITVFLIILKYNLEKCPRSLPWIFTVLSYNKVVEKALRTFLQFGCVASSLFKEQTSNTVYLVITPADYFYEQFFKTTFVIYIFLK